MDHIARPLPQPGLAADAPLDDAVQAANDYLTDRNREMRFDKRVLGAVALSTSVLAAVFGLGWAGELRKGEPPAKLIALDPTVGGLRLLGSIKDFDERFPANYAKLTDDWYLKELVKSREKYNSADRKQAFAAAACPLDEESAKRFKTWYEKDPQAPQQLFEQGGPWPGGWREIGTVGEPDVVGRGDGWMRYEVHIRAFDFLPGRVEPIERAAKVRFNARKDRAAVTDCNPRGFVVADWFTDLPRSTAP